MRGSNNLLTLYQLDRLDRTWFPIIAEPRPDMNIKVAAFTVSQKPYYC